MGAIGFDEVLGSQNPAMVIDQMHELHVRTYATVVRIIPR